MVSLNKFQEQILRFISNRPYTLHIINKNIEINKSVLLDNLNELYQIGLLKFHDKNDVSNNFRKNK